MCLQCQNTAMELPRGADQRYLVQCTTDAEAGDSPVTVTFHKLRDGSTATLKFCSPDCAADALDAMTDGVE